MTSDDRIVFVNGEINDGLRNLVDAFVLHQPRKVLVIGIEHEGPTFFHTLRHQRLDVENVFDGLDAILAHVIVADVCHHADVAPVVTQATSNHAAPRGFQHRNFNGRIRQYDLSRLWTSRVTFDDLLAADVNAVRRRHADAEVRLADDVTDHARDGRLSV